VAASAPHFYQLAIPAPRPPAGSFDAGAVDRGRQLFEGKARCASCHVPPLYTEPGWNTHTAAEIGIDDFQSDRDPDRRYRTTPLAGLWAHAKGGYYHDGRFATLADVVRHYDRTFGLGLADAEVTDLAEFLKSLPND
jgi:cytochrome c peroxidase